MNACRRLIYARHAGLDQSGSDRDMLIGETAGIVVGNHAPELGDLKESASDRIYFATAQCAGGFLEGLSRYGVLDSGDVDTHEANGSREGVKAAKARAQAAVHRLTSVL